jgi:AraC-like DNA-binding protein
MEHHPPVSGFGVAADAPALRVDYGLSRDSPLYADSNLFEEEMPLEVHVHEGIEFGILLSGRQERRFEGLVCEIGPGDVWLSATWEPHGFRISEPGSADVVVMFLPEFLGEERLGGLSWLALFAASPADRPRVTDEGTRQRMLAVAREMQREIAARQPGWETAVRLELLKALLTLGRTWTPPRHSHTHSQVRASNLPRIMPALVLVHSERGRRVSVAEAAGKCALGRAQFSLIFRHTMGMSFGRFCLRSRLGFVAELLLSTALPIQAIAQRAGFVDGSHMHRAFVARYGCRPGQYRTDNRPERQPIPQATALPRRDSTSR